MNENIINSFVILIDSGEILHSCSLLVKKKKKKKKLIRFARSFLCASLRTLVNMIPATQNKI